MAGPAQAWPGAGCDCRPLRGGHQPGGSLMGTANRRELVERAVKAEQIASLGEVFKTTKVVVVAHYSGLTVAQMQTLRRQMKQVGDTVKDANNRLGEIAIEGSKG